MEIYNWDENRILFTDKYGITFDIQLRGKIIIGGGKSGSGKTLLCNRINNILKDRNKLKNQYRASNIFMLNEDNIDKLSHQQHKLIIIDRADILLTDKDTNIINKDTLNRYLIMSRKPLKIEVSPNHFADFIKINNRITTNYEFNIAGWC